MTRQPFISPGVFGPEAIEGMGEAYDAAPPVSLTRYPRPSPGELFQRQHLVGVTQFACG
jgi:hypothetical protein